MGLPENRWFMLENPIKTDDLGGTPILGNLHFGWDTQFGMC